MAGHSKWANIKHKKAREDAKRGKIFTKLIREITVAAKLGGGDEGANPRLRAAVDTALGANMTKDTIQRAVTRGAGGEDGSDMDELTYEGYGPAGVAVMVQCLTDNRNRTVAEVRHAFSKSGGNLGTDGSVAYLFTSAGIIMFAPGADEDRILDVALEAGANDVVNHEDGSLEIQTDPYAMPEVKQALVDAGLAPDASEVSMLTSTSVDLNEEDAEKVLRLTDMLEDLDDVQSVHTNAAWPEES
jgi:YebC/PmpR family DNA-binding regulatory protein